MHDLLKNILTILSLVVHTIVQHFIERRGKHDIADHVTERSNSSKLLEERKGERDEETTTSK